MRVIYSVPIQERMQFRLRFYICLSIILLGTVCLVAARMIRRPQSLTTERVESVNTNMQTRHTFEKIPVTEAVATSRVPILMYHYIRTCVDPEDEQCPSLSVSVEAFTSQMQWLRDNGYSTVDLDYLSSPYRVDGQPVVITFDDGYADTYTDAFPVLERFGYRATWYIITDRVDTPGYLTWEQIQELDRRGMQIASHTLNHPDVTTLSAADVATQVTQSKLILEQKLGHTITDFCYPYGRYSSAAVEAVRSAGYLTATTTHEGVARRTDDALTLSRVRIKENTDLAKTMSVQR